MPHCPVPLVEKLFVVAAGALRKTREVEDFGGKTHDHVFPDGGGPGAAHGSDLGFAVLVSGGGIVPVVLAGPEGGSP